MIDLKRGQSKTIEGPVCDDRVAKAISKLVIKHKQELCEPQSSRDESFCTLLPPIPLPVEAPEAPEMPFSMIKPFVTTPVEAGLPMILVVDDEQMNIEVL